MSKDSKNMLDDNEVMAMIVGFMVGLGILALPNVLVKDAKQDAWIAAIIGIVYPLIITVAAIYLCKYYPNDSILVLSKKYLGKILGTICNFLFMIFFFIYVLLATTGFTNLFRVYATSFLSPIKIQIVVMLMVIYTSSKGLKVIAKVNEFSFYLLSTLMFFLSVSILKGNKLNIEPIFSVGVNNIFKASIESTYAYGGVEQILLIYPFMKNKNKLKSCLLKGIFITSIFYTWVTFVSIYFLGYRVAGKNIWPIFLVTESLSIPLINSLRSTYLLAWTGIMCNVLTNEYTAALNILSYILNVKSKKLLYVFTCLILLYLFTKIPNQIYRSDFAGWIIPKITVYSLTYIWIIVLLVFFDKNKKSRH